MGTGETQGEGGGGGQGERGEGQEAEQLQLRGTSLFVVDGDGITHAGQPCLTAPGLDGFEDSSWGSGKHQTSCYSPHVNSRMMVVAQFQYCPRHA